MTAAAPHRTTARSLVRAVAWLAALALGHLGLTAAGAALPAPPPPWEPEALLAWAETGDVARTSFALLRLLGLVTIWYLAALTFLVLVARASGLRPLAFLARRLALPWARGLIHHALGAGLAVSLGGGIVPGAGTAMASPAPRVTMSLVEEPPPPVMELMPDEAPAAGVAARPAGRSVARATASMHLLDAQADPSTWTIASGDHLWHVAAATLESHWGRPATEHEIARYWQALIERNHDRLAVPGEPDLVYPGQVFELPPVPGPDR